MKQNRLHPEIVEFVGSLMRLEGILSQHKVIFWAEKIARVRQIAEESDGYCIDMFLGLYGGMGSLNDLVLNAPPSVNDDLHEELQRAYLLAQALK